MQLPVADARLLVLAGAGAVKDKQLRPGCEGQTAADGRAGACVLVRGAESGLVCGRGAAGPGQELLLHFVLRQHFLFLQNFSVRANGL